MHVRRVYGEDAERAALTDLLRATVAAGGSVSFMHPLGLNEARAFWDAAFEDARGGGRVIWGAFEGDVLVGAVTLFLIGWPNQAHRGEVGKLMTLPGRRGRGAGRALMSALEAGALERGRWLLVLDTAAEGGAGPFYEGLGWRLGGEIPQFAQKPHGGLCATLIYWKRLDGGSL